MATEGVVYCHGRDYLDKFDPYRYLQRYLNDARTKHILRSFYDAFQALPSNQSVLDYGTGPSLLNAMVAAPKASEIILSEYSPRNRHLLHEWLEKDPAAFDWTPFIRFLVSDLEGKGEEGVREREERLRSVIKVVVECDMTQDPLIEQGYDRLYDVVTSSLVLDTQPRTNEEFTQILFRLGNLVKKGGSLFLYFAENGPFYQVGEYTFECLPMDFDTVARAMEIAGFGDIKSSDKCHSEGYTYFFIKGIKD